MGCPVSDVYAFIIAFHGHKSLFYYAAIGQLAEVYPYLQIL
ncbi:MAG: hypothetical protein P1S60_15860 [Anaerolineae bacterium]|nr:hypothetical protein [Anaerolineae bacterium]